VKAANPVDYPFDTGNAGVCGVFVCMSNELSTPKLVSCPSDLMPGHIEASTFSPILPPGVTGVPFTSDINVSYGVGVDANDQKPQMILTCDRNMGSDGTATPARAFNPQVDSNGPFYPSACICMGTNWVQNAGPAWTQAGHGKGGHNVGLADGSVHTLSRFELQNQLRNTGDSNDSFGNGGFMYCPGQTPGNSYPNRIQFP